jgi:hypothetical protein
MRVVAAPCSTMVTPAELMLDQDRVSDCRQRYPRWSGFWRAAFYSCAFQKKWDEFIDKVGELCPKHGAMPPLPFESGAHYLPAPKKDS